MADPFETERFRAAAEKFKAAAILSLPTEEKFELVAGRLTLVLRVKDNFGNTVFEEDFPRVKQEVLDALATQDAALDKRRIEVQARRDEVNNPPTRP